MSQFNPATWISNPNRGENVVKSGTLTCEQLCTTDWAVGKAQVRRGAEGGKGEEWKAVGHCHWIHASTHSLPHPLCQTHIFNVRERMEKVKRKCELVQKSCWMSTDFFHTAFELSTLQSVITSLRIGQAGSCVNCFQTFC